MSVDRCVCCGAVIPEGRQVCGICSAGGRKQTRRGKGQELNLKRHKRTGGKQNDDAGKQDGDQGADPGGL